MVLTSRVLLGVYPSHSREWVGKGSDKGKGGRGVDAA